MYILLSFQLWILLPFSKIAMLGKSYQLGHKAQPGIQQSRLSASRDTGISKPRLSDFSMVLWKNGR